MVGQPLDDFPQTVEYNEERDKDKVMTIDAHQFRTGVDQTVFAASADVENILNSLHFKFSEEQVDVIATNRFVLSLIMMVPENSAGIEGKRLTIPQQNIKYIKKVLSSAYTITILVDEKQILFTDSTHTVTTRIMGSEYINYQSLVKFQEFEGQAIIDRKSFSEAIRGINVMSSLIQGNVVILNIDFEENKDEEVNLHISTKTAEHGDAEDSLPLENVVGKLEIALDGSNLSKALSSMRSEKIKLFYQNGELPIYFQAIGEDLQNDHVCLVMPMQL